MAKSLTEKQQKVADWIKVHPGQHTPTAIGIGVGFSYGEASGSIAQTLKKLLHLGLIKRSVGSPRKVTYSWNETAPATETGEK